MLPTNVLFTIAMSALIPATMVSAAPSATTLWQPKVGDTWQIILSKVIDADAALTPDVSIFDLDMAETPAATIQKLKAKGKKVICYFSAGSSEEGRSDNNLLQAYKGTAMEGWPGENWIDIRQQGVRDVMKARITLAASKGCDAVDPDNMDGYENKNGLGLTKQDTIDYAKYLSQQASANGMSMGLKNAGDVIDQVLPYVAFSVNEQCNAYKECDLYNKFIKASKPVFNIEYIDGDEGNGSCPTLSGFSSVVKKMDLDGWIQTCAGVSVTTKTLK